MAVRYKPMRRGLGRLLKSPGMHALVKAKAEEGKAYAESISPDAPPYGQGYVTAFVVKSGLTVKVAKAYRATARLVNTSPHAAAVEWKHGHRVLGRTVDHIEDKLP